MNPDIQRIAEKWLDDFLGDCRLTFGMDETEKCLLLERFQEALTELSALRDTQERELREKVNVAERLCQIYFEIAAALMPESEVRRRRDERMEYPVFATHLLQENASLRAELARRDEVEGELRAKLMDKDLVMVRMIKNKQRDIDGAIECGQALGLTDGDERSLIQAAKDLRTENASLRSRIGELEAQLSEKA